MEGRISSQQRIHHRFSLIFGNWMNSTTWRPMGCFSGSDEPMESIQRMSRSYNASNFGSNYKSVDGRKTCVCSTGSTNSWPDKCYDKIWVGVHGKESICMVTLNEDVDMTRVDSFYRGYCTNGQTMCSYAQAIVSEVECLPYDDKLRERFGHSIEKPFGVVSVIPCTVHEGSGHEGSSSAEYDVEKAIDFLRDKMKSNLEFTFDETVQTAISALQHLWVKELKAEEIWVTTAWNVGSTEHMQLTEMKEHLSMINGGDGRPTTEIHRKRPFVPAPLIGTPFGECGFLCGPGTAAKPDLSGVVMSDPTGLDFSSLVPNVSSGASKHVPSFLKHIADFNPVPREFLVRDAAKHGWHDFNGISGHNFDYFGHIESLGPSNFPYVGNQPPDATKHVPFVGDQLPEFNPVPRELFVPNVLPEATYLPEVLRNL